MGYYAQRAARFGARRGQGFHKANIPTGNLREPRPRTQGEAQAVGLHPLGRRAPNQNTLATFHQAQPNSLSKS